MRLWLRRSLYLLVFLVWLVLILSPILAFVLAARGQIQFGEGPRSYLRLFLVQEDEAQGVGLEWVRPAAAPDTCSTGSLTYFLWEGESQNATFCQCYDPATNDLMSSTQQACQQP